MNEVYRTSNERGCYVMDGVTYTSHEDGSETSRKATNEEVLIADALLRATDQLRFQTNETSGACQQYRELLAENTKLKRAAHEPPAVQGPCPNCGAKWVSAELSASQEPQTDLPKPINHNLWRHLHDEHGLTLLQSELDEILRLAPPPEEALRELIAIARAARDVCAYDWSDNDDDAVAAMDRLSVAVGPWLARSTSTKEEAP